MLLDDVTQFVLYRDSDETEPYEDPDRIRERVETLATEAGAEVEVVDLADRSPEECETLLEEVRDRVVDKPYVVDNRIFSPETFGSKRPALLVEYEAAPADVYPHRNYDVEEKVPISVMDALDELDGEGAEADIERVHTGNEEDRTAERYDGDPINSPTGAAVRVAEKAVSSITSF